MKEEICKYMKRLCDSGLTTSLGGNISCRLDDSILITPSSIDKYNLSPGDIVKLSCKGEKMEGAAKASIESMMHVNVYNKRGDVKAMIHAHPLFSTMFSASKDKIDITYTAEAAKNIKVIALAKYETMGTNELAEAVSEASLKSDVILMENHGVVTLGTNLLEAFYKMEILENAAKMTFYSRFIDMHKIQVDEQLKLMKM